MYVESWDIMTKRTILRAERQKLMDALLVMDKTTSVSICTDSLEFLFSALERKDPHLCELATSLLKKEVEDKWK